MIKETVKTPKGKTELKLHGGTKPKEVIEFAKKSGIKIIDLKFVDFFGTWQHFSITIDELDEGLFSDGIGFDGSSIRGFQHIHESDMLIKPDANTAVIDPVCEIPTLSLICDVWDPVTMKPYTRDPRFVAKKAEEYLRNSRIADISYWGPEIEFFVFDNVRFDQGTNYGFYYIDSDEGIWNSGREWNGTPNLGYRPRYKEGYFPVPPTDSIQDFRSAGVQKLMELGIRIEVHHHEVATAGQCEIDMRYDSMTNMADKVMYYKYVWKNLAKKYNKTVTFMPKPLFGDNGSGMHVHQSLWKAGKNLFFDPSGYALTSDMCRWYIGGLLKHAPALMAFCAPTTNSYRRLVPGYEAPVNLVYSKRNRSAAIRIPVYSTKPATKRLEFRPPDPTANPYLVFAALLMAGLDGVKNKIEPPAPVDKDIYELSAEEKAQIASVPGSLEESLNALAADHDFLLEGGVFTREVIDTWISIKRAREVDAIKLRPHPYEYYLYYDM